MKKKKIINLVWSISLILVGIIILIIAKFDLSDVLIRTFGIMEIVAISILVYTSVIKIKNK